MSVGKKSFERVEQFRYLGTAITTENRIHEEIKSGFKVSRNRPRWPRRFRVG